MGRHGPPPDEGMDSPAEPELPPEVALGVDVTELQEVLLTTMRDPRAPRHLRVQIANRLLTASGRLGADVKGTDPGESDPELLVRQIAEMHNSPLLDRWFRPKKPREKVDDPNRIYQSPKAAISELVHALPGAAKLI